MRFNAVFFFVLTFVVALPGRCEVSEVVELESSEIVVSAHAVVFFHSVLNDKSNAEGPAEESSKKGGANYPVKFERIADNRWRFLLALSEEDRKRGESYIVFAATDVGQIISSAVQPLGRGVVQLNPYAVQCMTDPRLVDQDSLSRYSKSELRAFKERKINQIARLNAELNTLMNGGAQRALEKIERQIGVVKQGAAEASSFESLLKRAAQLDAIENRE